MQPLGLQMSSLLNRRFAKVNEEACVPFLHDIFERMKRNTEGGRTFPNQESKYDNKYSDRHTRARKAQGYQVGYVDLRFKNKRILDPKPNKLADGAEIGFAQGGDVFYSHHYGVDNMPERKIFPEEWSNVPDDIKAVLFQRVGRIMNGRNA
jgi:hypothetical protein